MNIERHKEVGIDVKGLLEYVGGDETLAKFALNMFLEDTTYEKVLKSREDNNPGDMIKSVHELKGVAAALHANDIGDITVKILTKLRAVDYDDIDDLYKQLDEKYLKLREAIKKIG